MGQKYLFFLFRSTILLHQVERIWLGFQHLGTQRTYHLLLSGMQRLGKRWWSWVYLKCTSALQFWTFLPHPGQKSHPQPQPRQTQTYHLRRTVGFSWSQGNIDSWAPDGNDKAEETNLASQQWLTLADKYLGQFYNNSKHCFCEYIVA